MRLSGSCLEVTKNPVLGDNPPILTVLELPRGWSLEEVFGGVGILPASRWERFCAWVKNKLRALSSHDSRV